MTQRVLICERLGLNCHDCNRRCPLSEHSDKEISDKLFKLTLPEDGPEFDRFEARKKIDIEELIRELSAKDDFDFCILICHWQGRRVSFHTGARNKNLHHVAMILRDHIKAFLKGATK